MPEITIRKIDIALVQLETAIILFTEYKNYICAATLAGAAEEILGSIISYNDEAEETAFKIICSSIKEKYKPEKTLKEIGYNYVNFHRNEFKHYHDKSLTEITVDDRKVAISLICRAITNLAIFDKSATYNTERFFQSVCDVK